MIEKNVEKKIIDAIEALNIPDLQVVGLWQPSATNIVKGTEQSDAVGALVVKIPPKAFDTFGICEVTMDVQMILTVRVEKDSTGENLVKFVEPITDLLEAWNLDLEGNELEALVTEDFTPGGVQVNAGSGPTFDPQTNSWSVEFSLTIRGLKLHPHN